jgi:Fe-S cluster biosynthesis and repair protein YggX
MEQSAFERVSDLSTSDDHSGLAVTEFRCRRHPEEDRIALPGPPFKGALGERVHTEICADCWKDWLTHQTVLMNHFGLDPRRKEARTFLYEQLRAVLFDEGEVAPVDTAQQGSIGWDGRE